MAYVRSSLLDATAISPYRMIDRIVKDLKYEEKGFYLPPYPKDVYLLEHLKGLKELIVFIPVDGGEKLPPLEEVEEHICLGKSKSHLSAALWSRALEGVS